MSRLVLPPSQLYPSLLYFWEAAGMNLKDRDREGFRVPRGVVGEMV